MKQLVKLFGKAFMTVSVRSMKLKVKKQQAVLVVDGGQKRSKNELE